MDMTSSLPALKLGEGNITWESLMIEQAHILVEGLQEQPGTKEWKDELIVAAVEWDGGIHDKPKEFFIHRYFWPEIRRLTDCDLDYILDWVEEVRQRKKLVEHDRIVGQATIDAMMKFQEGDAAAAREILALGAVDAENALADKSLEPVLSVAETIPQLLADLKKLQGVKHPGMVQKRLPELDDALGGFQGLTLISAASGEGKTMLVTQCMLDMLEADQDACAVFVSMDMSYQKLRIRMLTNLSQLPIRTVQSGTGEGGWTPDEAAIVGRSVQKLKELGTRIKVLSRDNCKRFVRPNIMREMAQWMKTTGKKRIILIVDFLELWDVPESVKNPDDWMIEEVRYIADAIYPNPVLVIAESRKNDTQGESYGQPTNIKGSGRKVYRSDCIIMLNAFQDSHLLEMYNLNENGGVQFRAEKEPYKEKDSKERAEKIRKVLATHGMAPLNVKVGKARDGAIKTEFTIMNNFQKNLFTPLKK